MVYLCETYKDRRIKCRGCKKIFEKDKYWILNGYKSKWHVKCYGQFSQRVQRLRLITFPDICYPSKTENSKPLGEWWYHPEVHKLDDPQTIRDVTTIFPEIVPWKDRPFLTLSKEIDAMSTKELKLELAKRDFLPQGVGNLRKARLRFELKEALDFGELCKRRSKVVAIGYCRSMEGKEHKLNVPIYLKQLVVDYLGEGLMLQRYSHKKNRIAIRGHFGICFKRVKESRKRKHVKKPRKRKRVKKSRKRG